MVAARPDCGGKVIVEVTTASLPEPDCVTLFKGVAPAEPDCVTLFKDLAPAKPDCVVIHRAVDSLAPVTFPKTRLRNS